MQKKKNDLMYPVEKKIVYHSLAAVAIITFILMIVAIVKGYFLLK